MKQFDDQLTFVLAQEGTIRARHLGQMGLHRGQALVHNKNEVKNMSERRA